MSRRNRENRLSLNRLLLAILTLALSAWANAQNTEQQVKAAFIYNFTKFVSWPAAAFSGDENQLVINVVGDDSLDHALDATVAGKEVDGRSIVVRHVTWRDAENCQILFVPSAESGHSLAHLRGRPILIVGESPGFARRGGIVNFILEGGRVRFEIAADTARESGLIVSSRLLSLAKAPS